MRAPDGALYRTWKPGHAAHLNGYLEDHANVADGLVALYEATFDPRWLDGGRRRWPTIILARFADRGQRRLLRHVVRPRDADHPAEGHLRQRHAVGQRGRRRRAAAAGAADRQRRRIARGRGGVLELLREPMARYPLGFARSLNALDFLLGRPKEVAIVGRPGAADTAGAAARRVRAVRARTRWSPARPATAAIPLARRPRATRRQGHRLRVRALRLPGADDRPGRAAHATDLGGAFGGFGQLGPARGQVSTSGSSAACSRPRLARSPV